jgi:DNA-binding XRE family transcriptional regulator
MSSLNDDPFLPRQLSPQELRLCRRRLEVTQKELAKSLSVSESTLQAWETGKRQPRHPNMVDLAIKTLGMGKQLSAMQAAIADQKAGIDRGPCAPWRFGE